MLFPIAVFALLLLALHPAATAERLEYQLMDDCCTDVETFGCCCRSVRFNKPVRSECPQMDFAKSVAVVTCLQQKAHAAAAERAIIDQKTIVCCDMVYGKDQSDPNNRCKRACLDAQMTPTLTAEQKLHSIASCRFDVRYQACFKRCTRLGLDELASFDRQMECPLLIVPGDGMVVERA